MTYDWKCIRIIFHLIFIHEYLCYLISFTQQKEAPEYIKKLVFHLSSLSASAQSLSQLLSRDFPSELKANLASIQDDIFECRDGTLC